MRRVWKLQQEDNEALVMFAGTKRSRVRYQLHGRGDGRETAAHTDRTGPLLHVGF
jgi:hypothetical protein